MSENGAGRKVKRLNQIADKIRAHGTSGINQSTLEIWAERNLGLSPERCQSYIRVLERTREVSFDPERRKYYSLLSSSHSILTNNNTHKRK